VDLSFNAEGTVVAMPEHEGDHVRQGETVALIVKELAGLWRDPKTRFIILVPPIMQVALFAYAATYDVTNVPLGIWNDDAGAQSAELVRRFAGSPAFAVTGSFAAPEQARAALDARTFAVVLHVPQNFSADVLAGRVAQAQLLLDARRSNSALMAQGYAAAIVAAFARDLHPTRGPPVVLLRRDWFNPTLESTWFILPGLVCVLSMIMALLISALSLARERELGTFEQLLVTPLRPADILLGNVVLLQAMLVLYMLTGVGIGLVLSSFARTQQQAMLGMFVFASPMIVLSGYAAPIENMPYAAELISRADPVRYMLVAARGLFLQDMPLAVLLSQAWPMALIAVAALTVAGFAVRRALS
jgi:ABC-2 type transport system permease protein